MSLILNSFIGKLYYYFFETPRVVYDDVSTFNFMKENP